MGVKPEKMVKEGVAIIVMIKLNKRVIKLKFLNSKIFVIYIILNLLLENYGTKERTAEREY